MNLADLQTAMVTAIQTALGDLSYDVAWGDREDRWRDSSHVILTMVSVPRRGQDEIRTTPEGSDDVRERVYGIRNPVIQVRCEADDQDLDESAWAIADTITSRLRGTDVVDLLAAADVGIARVGDLIDGSYQDADGRWHSGCVFELFLNTHTSVTGALVPRIKSIEYSGTTDGPSVGPTTVTE